VLAVQRVLQGHRVLTLRLVDRQRVRVLHDLDARAADRSATATTTATPTAASCGAARWRLHRPLTCEARSLRAHADGVQDHRQSAYEYCCTFHRYHSIENGSRQRTDPGTTTYDATRIVLFEPQSLN